MHAPGGERGAGRLLNGSHVECTNEAAQFHQPCLRQLACSAPGQTLALLRIFSMLDLATSHPAPPFTLDFSLAPRAAPAYEYRIFACKTLRKQEH